MTKYGVWEAVRCKDILTAAKLIYIKTWTMKKKANGMYRAQLKEEDLNNESDYIMMEH